MHKAIGAMAVALLLAGPAHAQEDGTLRQWWNDMLGVVDPWLADLADKLGDLTGWHSPEVLENGDILIRRRRPTDPPADQPSESPSDPSVPLEL
jgi:hypothetical protein